MAKAILVVGGINLDVVCLGPRLPVTHEKAQAASISFWLGGVGANTAYGLAESGLKVSLIGAVGSDVAGSFCRRALAAVGFSADDIVTVSGASTGISVVWSTPEDKRVLTQRGPSIDHALQDRDRSFPLDGGILHLATEATGQVAEFCASAVGDGLQLTAEFNGSALESVRPMVSLAFMNADELYRIFGIKWRELRSGMVREILPLPSARLVVTLGPRGAICVDACGTTKMAMTRPVTIIDRTGAGDAFDAGFLTEYARDGSPEECLARGLLSASKIIEMIGPGTIRAFHGTPWQGEP